MEPDSHVLREKGVPVSEEVHQKSPASTSIDYSGVDEKALLRRMDLRILPMIVILYIFAFIDRYVAFGLLFTLSSFTDCFVFQCKHWKCAALLPSQGSQAHRVTIQHCVVLVLRFLRDL
jgi:hypothetical protein